MRTPQFEFINNRFKKIKSFVKTKQDNLHV